MNARTIGIVLLAGAAALLASIGASAAPVAYDGPLFPGATRQGSVPTGDGWINNRGSEVDYWFFLAATGDMVTIRVHPLDPRLDPAFSFYRGLTTADTSQFNNFDDWGGMTFIDFGATLTGRRRRRGVELYRPELTASTRSPSVAGTASDVRRHAAPQPGRMRMRSRSRATRPSR